MVYLVIKELADTAEDVIMVTSSVMKDVAGGGRGAGEQELYRANAIRALCRIIDVSWRIYLWELKGLATDAGCLIGGPRKTLGRYISLGIIFGSCKSDFVLSFY